MRIELLPGVVVAIPLASALLILLLWLGRHLLDSLTRASVRAEKALRWLPPKGRLSRAAGWSGLFITLLLLLAEPSLPEIWNRVLGTGFSLSSERWLVAVSVCVVAICAAVAAWVDNASELAWAGLSLTLAATLTALAAEWTPLAFISLDLLGLLFTATIGYSATRPERDLERGSTLRAMRRFAVMTLLASALTWAGWALNPDSHLGMIFFLLGLLLRAGAFPGHLAYLTAAARLPLGNAMMLLGAVIPAAITLAGSLLHQANPLLIYFLLAGSALCWLAAPREPDLGRTVARWAVASANSALAVSLTGSLRAATLMVVLSAVGSAAAIYLIGSVERTAGHRETGRIRGLGARLPAVFGWLVVIVIALAGGPPFAAFAGKLLASLADNSLLLPVALSLLSILGLGCALSSVHRTFLGIPRHEEDGAEAEPTRLQGRERLVLVMLGACALGSTLAPLSLWRTPIPPAPLPSIPPDSMPPPRENPLSNSPPSR